MRMLAGAAARTPTWPGYERARRTTLRKEAVRRFGERAVAREERALLPGKSQLTKEIPGPRDEAEPGECRRRRRAEALRYGAIRVGATRRSPPRLP
jgi:hypothetical protein